MSVLHDPNRLYAFLGPDGISTENVEATSGLTPRIADFVKDMSELIVSKEITLEDSPWEVRLHTTLGIIGGREVAITSGDPLDVAESYIEHVGSATLEEQRAFTADRPLKHSPTGASRFRLEIDAPAEKNKEGYNYTLTAYNGPALGRSQTDPHHSVVKPLPPILPRDIRSQFLVSSFVRDGEQVPLVRSVTFDSTFEPEWLAIRTSIDAPTDRLAAVHSSECLPKLSQNQQMLHRTLGAGALLHYNLAQMLRHLKEGNR